MGKLILTEYNPTGALTPLGIEIDVTIPIALTKSIADIQKPDGRQGEFSKTIKIGGSAAINKAFTHIYDINGVIDNTDQYDPSFNPNKRAKIQYTEEGILQLEGYLRLINITKILGTSKIEYSCQVLNNVSDFWNIIANKKMADIDLTKYNHTLSYQNVRKSWDQNVFLNGVQIPFAKGTGYVHGFINKTPYTSGGSDPTASWEVGETTPMLYAKELVSEIYSDAGQVIKSGGFFDSAEFLNWVVPYNGTGLGLTDTTIDDNKLIANSSADVNYGTGGIVKMNTTVQDTSGSYTNATGVWASPINGKYIMRFDGTVRFTIATTLISNAIATLTFIWINRTTGERHDMPVTIVIPPTAAPFTYDVVVDIISNPLTASVSDAFDLSVTTSFSYAVSYFIDILAGAEVTIKPTEAYYSSGSTVNFKNFLSAELTQKDFMLDLFKTFNLVAELNQSGEHIIETRDTYLSNTVLDVSSYVNTDRDVVYTPMGALNANPYVFTYKEDKDMLNELHKFRNEEPYGTKTFDIDNDFIKNKKEIKVNYSPSAMQYFYLSGMSLVDTTFIDQSYNVDDKKVPNYRLIRYEGIKDCNDYNVIDSTGTTYLTAYPLIGHIDDADAPTLDGLFGMPKQHYLKPTIQYSANNLFYQYHLKQYAEITDKNSKIVDAWLNIPASLYPQMTFDKLYWFDNAYFRLNKVYDYRNREDTRCEFIKVINYTKPALTGSTGNGGQDEDDGLGDYYPVYGGTFNVRNNLGLAAGSGNNINQDSFAVGDNNNAQTGQHAFIGSSGNQINSDVTRAVLINTDNQTITQDGVYINGELFAVAGAGTNFIFVNSVDDLPDAVSSVITLAAGVTYYFVTDIDLNGDRLETSQDTVILGASSENASITSTGLAVSVALLTSEWTTPIRNITFKDVDTCLSFDGSVNNMALDWSAVNFQNIPNIGTIDSAANFIYSDGAFLSSANLIFDGTIGTVAFSDSLLISDGNGTPILQTLPTTTITRRFRVIYTALSVASGDTGIDFNSSTTVPDEAYILDTVNLSGSGTYLAGLDYTSEKALFINCVGIINTYALGKMYMIANGTATTISDTTSYVKVAGTTTAGGDNSKFIHTPNRLTCTAAISRRYSVKASVTFIAGNNNQVSFAFYYYDGTSGSIITESVMTSTANSAGRSENAALFDEINMDGTQYIELHVKNNSATSNVIVEDMNFLLTEIN